MPADSLFRPPASRQPPVPTENQKSINSGDCAGDSGKSYRVNWRSRVRAGSAESYAFATICVVIASLVRWELGRSAKVLRIFRNFAVWPNCAEIQGSCSTGGTVGTGFRMVAGEILLIPYK